MAIAHIRGVGPCLPFLAGDPGPYDIYITVEDILPPLLRLDSILWGMGIVTADCACLCNPNSHGMLRHSHLQLFPNVIGRPIVAAPLRAPLAESTFYPQPLFLAQRAAKYSDQGDGVSPPMTPGHALTALPMPNCSAKACGKQAPTTASRSAKWEKKRTVSSGMSVPVRYIVGTAWVSCRI
ncbi:hypothetical protein MCOR07_004863 [Pyricularia oryzae]|nr:hypothetical protein MCOR30_007439 [Pyricularia oryzae]KAI6621475.1 hypothetical protein MCOR07_004863 [Pyricularia oryzae]